ncbi:hypothetical protein K504DRAFT_500287 [Pleomassaria siparia CBS 279.74]|uniref:Uncharacterized protein n=1 Tax=Pleomassaria siparia CBS 279.74 TaxID=1314801 RepID=A0A6G1KFS6_9PLEO|nr:hypothetical protein K504DRAFT_500287 [Pleomassaria siparia CBS 279.74]
MTGCRALRTICRDRHLFRQIAERTSIYNSDTKCVEWQDGSVLLDRASPADTIRIAYAAERATKRGNVQIPQWGTKYNHQAVDPDVRDWLPHLVALRHPVCLKLFRPEHLLGLHYQLSTPEPEPSSEYHSCLLGVEFCMIALILEQICRREDFYPGFAEQWEEIIEIHKEERKINEQIGYLLGIHDGDDLVSLQTPPGISRSLFERVLRLRRVTGKQSYAEVSATILHMLFFINGIQATQHLTAPLPEPSRMPFHTWMNVPMVYGSERRAFHECHAWWATKITFLTGTWMGYTTDERQDGPTLEAPMQNINMTLLVPTENGNPAQGNLRRRAVIDAASEGHDGDGKFSLRGSVYVDGSVTMWKLNEVGREWIYRGFVTPFGIAGSWGSHASHHWGRFWLWKKEWSRDDAEEETKNYPQ